MSISKKIRFEVFKRDGFTCQYCGKHPPEVTLEIDHIKPKSKEGRDDINNLVTACFDCNRGKSNIELKQVPNKLAENKEIIEEREKQYVEYHKLLAKIQKRINSEVNEVTNIFENYFSSRTLTDSFKRTSVKMFIGKLGVFQVCDAMEIACDKFYSKSKSNSSSDYAIKYFCGICWNKIKDNG